MFPCIPASWRHCAVTVFDVAWRRIGLDVFKNYTHRWLYHSRSCGIFQIFNRTIFKRFIALGVWQGVPQFLIARYRVLTSLDVGLRLTFPSTSHKDSLIINNHVELFKFWIGPFLSVLLHSACDRGTQISWKIMKFDLLTPIFDRFQKFFRQNLWLGHTPIQSRSEQNQKKLCQFSNFNLQTPAASDFMKNHNNWPTDPNFWPFPKFFSPKSLIGSHPHTK